MAGEVVASLPGGVTLIVVNGLQPPKLVAPSRIRVGKIVLEADASISLMAEKVASLLLLPPLDGGDDWLEEVARLYLRRVAVEEALNLRFLMGEALDEARVHPAVLLLMRARETLARHHPCLAARLTGGVLRRAWERLEAESIEAGVLQDGRVGAASSLKIYLAAMASALRRYARLAAPPAPTGLGGDGCAIPEVIKDPGMALRLPTGRARLAPGCKQSKCKCKPFSVKSGSLRCECPHGVLVLKSYTRMMVKWVAAAPVAGAAYRFRISPHARMGAEYKWLLRLRASGIQAPEPLRVCSWHGGAEMLRTFLDGETLEDLRDEESWRLGGELLARIHVEARAALGDPNPGNIMPRVGGVIDAEQARPISVARAAWDIASITAYSLVISMVSPRLVESLLEGYFSRAGKLGERVAEALMKPGFAARTPIAVAPLALKLIARAAGWVGG